MESREHTRCSPTGWGRATCSRCSGSQYVGDVSIWSLCHSKSGEGQHVRPGTRLTAQWSGTSTLSFRAGFRRSRVRACPVGEHLVCSPTGPARVERVEKSCHPCQWFHDFSTSRAGACSDRNDTESLTLHSRERLSCAGPRIWSLRRHRGGTTRHKTLDDPLQTRPGSIAQV